MFVLQLKCSAAAEDAVVGELWEQGTAGITEENAPGGRVRLSAFFETRFDETPFAAYEPRWEELGDRDWVAVSRSKWDPVAVGRRFYLVPAWSADPTPPGRLRLEMRPGQACGTGWHPATQLCLEAMELCIAPGAAVLDVGTGSGILSVAAALLGAGTILACDIDPRAAEEASARFRGEGVAAGVFAGSLRSVRDAAADVVIANINAEALIDLAPDMQRVRRRGGGLILSGFPARHLERVQAAHGPCTKQLEKDGWIALVYGQAQCAAEFLKK